MKKFLSLLAVLALVLSCTVMGIGTVASAAEESPEEDFLVYDGMLEEYVGAGGDVVIPASLGIVEIGERAFYENEDIVSLVIPEGVEAIGSFCFYACKNLEKLTLPYSLYEIGTHAFSQTALTEVTIPGNVDYVPYGCFSGSSLLKDVKLSYGVKEVWTGAFNTNSIQKIVFPETVEVLCGHSLTLCKDASVTRIEIYICNPDCEIGVASNNIDNVKKGVWDMEVTPWSHNTSSAVYNVYVVKDSEAHKTLEEKGKEWMAADTGGAKDDALRIHDEDQSFFDELPENQKDFGIQKPVQTGTEDPSTGENPTDTTPGGSTGSQNGTTQNNTNTNNNNGVNGDNSLTTILIVVIAAVAVIIIAVIIAMVIYLSKSKKPAKNAASTEDEIRAKIKLEEEIRAKLLKETQEEAVAETEQAVEENSSDAE